jgi:hypothetical protein
MNHRVLYFIGLLIALIILLLFFGCSPCDPIIIDREVPIIDTVTVVIPAKADSVAGKPEGDHFTGTFTGKTDTVLIVKFYPRDTAFTYESFPDTFIHIITDTIKVPNECPDNSPSFWTIIGWIGAGIFLMTIAFLILNGLKPELINQVTNIFKKS